MSLVSDFGRAMPRNGPCTLIGKGVSMRTKLLGVALAVVLSGTGGLAATLSAEQLHCEFAAQGTLFDVYDSQGNWQGTICYGGPENCCRSS
jgi:hypothetical protein